MKHFSSLLALLLFLSACSHPEVKTTFQTSCQWKPTLDNRADAVLVYGVRQDGSFESRVSSWKERGYRVQFMTGSAWGDYKDYFIGEWDGASHLDEGQITAEGDTLWHSRMVPYVVPTRNFLDYLKERHIRRAIDAGIDEIFLEEPEFWAKAGYSEAFKKEWKDFYGSEWMPQDDSPETMYLSGKLKYYLYYRALDELFSFAKEYGRIKGMNVRCYVPTHSLINYTQWKIVSPEASLASLECVDGYIAQVWTGTSRVLNYFGGVKKSRVFETAFLEYGTMESMIAPTGRKIYFLTDPIEDGIRDWDDYKRNYQATFTAQLLYPKVSDYEIMPWPERIYEGRYRISPDSEDTAPIPSDFATMMQVMVNSLNRVPSVDEVVSGTHGVAVLMGNSMMFRHTAESLKDDVEPFSDFFGLTLPLLKRGVPVEIVHIENLKYKKTLKDKDVLLMTYSDMKPFDHEAHSHIAEWVRKGGTLIYSGRDDDLFRSVREWWNSGDNSFACPSDHLFALMGIAPGAPDGEYAYGKGSVRIVRKDPSEFVEASEDSVLLSSVSEAVRRNSGSSLMLKNNFRIERGAFDIVAVMDESVDEKPVIVQGVLIDLFDPGLPVVTSKEVLPGHQGYFVNMSRVGKGPCVIAASGREYDEKCRLGSYSFRIMGPDGTEGIARVKLPSAPSSVMVNGDECVDPAAWDGLSGTYLLRYPNCAEGACVAFSYGK